MKKWAIIPGEITVPSGAEVELIVSSADVEHGLAIPKLGIREPVRPGNPTRIYFKAPAPGQYPMKCSVLCGRGHDDMTGILIVTAGSARADTEFQFVRSATIGSIREARRAGR